MGNFIQGRLQLSSIASYQPPVDREASNGRKWALMKKLGYKGTLLCGEAGAGLGVRSKSLHLLQGAASFRPLGATGNGQVNASHGNEASEGCLYLTLAGRQRHSNKRCHLTTAHYTNHGYRGATRRKLAKCGRHSKNHKCWRKWVGVLGDGPWGGVARGQEECEDAEWSCSKAGHGPLTNPSVLADPGARLLSSQPAPPRAREIGKRDNLIFKVYLAIRW